ncbi:ATP-binding protein [Salidesulfovibrio brasiliensis]
MNSMTRALWRHPVRLTLAICLLVFGVTAAVFWYTPGRDLKLTAEEREWLSNHRTIRLGVTPSTRPLEFFGGKAEYKGMVADYMHILSDRLGVRFEVVETTNLKKLLHMAEDREVDVIAAFWANPATIKYMRFTRPYLVIPTVILVNKNQKEYLQLKDMSDMDLALPKSNAVIDYVRKYYPRIHIQPVYNYLAALLHVSFDEIDATIISLPQASYFIEEKGITNLRVAGHTDYKIYHRIATRSDWPILNSIMQKGLDSITQTERDAIYRKWVTLDQHYISFLLQNKHFWFYFGGATLFIILFVAFIISWNRTLQKRVSEKTRELKDELNARVRLMTAIEQAQDGIFIISTDGIMEYMNPSFERMSGYALEELEGKHVSVIRSDRQSTEFFEELWKDLIRGDVWRGQTTYRSKSGHDYEVDLSISPIHDNTGKMTGYVEVARDITEQLQMEKQLRQSQKLEELGTLAGGIAHDFNNILAAILGYAELAQPTLEPGTRGYDNLDRIIHSAKRAKEMVHQILVFSRRRKPDKARVDMVPLLNEVGQFLEVSLPSTIEVRSDIAVSSGWVIGDSSQIHQVVTNLGTNAAYAMSENGGTLTISLDRAHIEQAVLLHGGRLEPGDYLRLTVADTGTGIPEEVMGRIFDPFFTTKPQTKGTGLGLSMVHGIVGSMHGGIDVKSTLDEGTIFHIYLPESEGTAPRVEFEEGDVVTGKGRILLVDDEEDMVAVGTQMLTDLGYAVQGVQDSNEALELFRSSPDSFDLLITDQTMPRMTGDRLAKAVHEIRPELPVILCTGYSASLDNLRPGEAGIRSVLMKPFEMAKLSRVVGKVFETLRG